MDPRFVRAVTGWLKLEAGMLDTDLEVLGDAGLELVEDLRGVTIVKAGVVQNHMSGQNRQTCGYL